MKTSTMKNKFKYFLIVLFWIFIWQIASLLIPEEILFVSPLKVIPKIFSNLFDRIFYISMFNTLYKITLGFLIGFLSALLLALLSYKIKFISEFLKPFISFVKAVPIVSFIVLALFFLRAEYLSILISAIISLPIIYINTLEGLLSVDKDYLKMCSVLKIGLKNRIKYIFLPQLKPFLQSGISLAVGMSWKSGLAAEVIGLPKYGLGTLIYNCKIYLDTENLFAYTIAAIIVCFICEKLALFILGRICK